MRRMRAKDFCNFPQRRARGSHIIHNDPLLHRHCAQRIDGAAHAKQGCLPLHSPAARHASGAIELRLIHARLLRQHAQHLHRSRSRKRPRDHLRMINAALHSPRHGHGHRHHAPLTAALTPHRRQRTEHASPLLREEFSELLATAAIPPILQGENHVAPASFMRAKPNDCRQRPRRSRARRACKGRPMQRCVQAVQRCSAPKTPRSKRIRRGNAHGTHGREQLALEQRATMQPTACKNHALHTVSRCAGIERFPP